MIRRFFHRIADSLRGSFSEKFIVIAAIVVPVGICFRLGVIRQFGILGGVVVFARSLLDSLALTIVWHFATMVIGDRRRR